MKEIYSALRKSAAKVYILGGIIFVLLGVVILFGICQNLFKYIFFDAPDLFETPSSQYAAGKWYTCDNNILYDYYCSDGKGRYYVTSTNDGEYMGFYVYNKKTDIADQISDGTYDYLDGIEESLPPIYLSGKGYIQEMDSTERRYFEDFFEAGGNDISEYKFVYYNFKMVTPIDLILDDDGDNNLFYVIIAVIMFLCGLTMIIYFLCGGYKNPIKKSMKKYGILEDVLVQDLAGATRIENALIGNKHVLFFAFPGTMVIPYDSLVWAYVMITTTKHTTYGIPTGTTKSYQFIMWDRNHKKNLINIKSDTVGHQILDEMYRRAPYFFTGFNNDLASATDHGKFNSMIAAVDERRNAYLSQQVPMYQESNINNVLY
jgi:hypothetical protein